MHSARLVAIIVNYKTPELTLNCLRSLLPQVHDRDIVVIVDNASRDSSVAMFNAFIQGENNSGVCIIESAVNLGYAGAINLAIKKFPADMYLVLNSDITLKSDCIKHMASMLYERKRCGMVVPAIIDETGATHPSCFRFISPLSEFIATAQTSMISKMFSKYEAVLRGNFELKDIQWVSFAAVLLHAEMVHEIGLMDEGYFLYFEDADYCWRAKNAGWNLGFEAKAVVIHKQSSSTGVEERRRLRKRLPDYFYRARRRYFFKYYGPLGWGLANTAVFMGKIIFELKTICKKIFL